MSEQLYIIVPYFNFINYKSGIKNLEIFINNFSKYKNVQIVLVEGYYKDQQLPDYSTKIFKHIKLPLKHILWVKENLINIGFSCLPSDWQYGGWIDRDIEFINPNWVDESIEKLKTCDLLQPWTQCVFLNSNFEHVRICGHIFAESFCSLFKKNLLTKENLFSDRHTHSGQAWCINKKFYNHLGGLYERAILGGADFLWVIGVLNTQNSHHCVKGIDDDIKLYLAKIKEAKVDYVHGIICHLYHGEYNDRRYIERYEILRKYKYLPLEDTLKDENGVLCYTDSGVRMEHDIKNYFLVRRE